MKKLYSYNSREAEKLFKIIGKTLDKERNKELILSTLFNLFIPTIYQIAWGEEMDREEFILYVNQWIELFKQEILNVNRLNKIDY